MATLNLEPIKTTLLRESAATPRLNLRDLVERSAGVLLCAAAAPVTAASALASAVFSGRSPFVAHLRVGKNDQLFWMWKIRTMWDRRSGPRTWEWIEYVVSEPLEDGKPANDPRVTSRFAAFCRRHSIDELPQLWNVVRGEMSLVGPRPLTRTEVDRHYGPRASELLSVKPGLTGLWQVSGRSTIRFPQRAAMDLELVRRLSPRLYVQILLRTTLALVSGQGAW